MYKRQVLLEPWYDFRLEVPQDCVGRAMADLQRRCAEFSTDVYKRQGLIEDLYTLHSRQYRIILSTDTASEVRQMLSQKRR